MYLYNYSNRKIDSFSAKSITEINKDDLLKISNIINIYNQELFIFNNEGSNQLYDEFCDILTQKQWYLDKINHFETLQIANYRYNKYKVKNIRLKKEISRLLTTNKF